MARQIRGLFIWSSSEVNKMITITDPMILIPTNGCVKYILNK